MAVAFRSPFPMLACNDLGASMRFYCDLLGFVVSYRVPLDGAEPAVFVALTLDGATLGLGGKDGPTIHGRRFGEPGGHFFEFCVTADDVDAAVDWLRSAGVPVLVEPCDQPWGERIAYVTDPDGHPVMIVSPGSDEA